MKDKKSSESRRKLLKSIAAGGGAVVAGKSLPESWSRPVVDSVMLPAHAATSAFNYSTRQSLGSVTPESNNLFAGLISNAHAGEVISGDFVDYCVDVFGTAWRAAIRVTTIEGCLIAVWWAEGTVGGGAVTMTQNLCADFKHPNITFNVKANDASTAIVEILEGGEPNPLTSIPIGTCPFGDPAAEQCCEIAGNYCGMLDESSRTIDITVDPNGDVSIAVSSGRGPAMAYTSVNPFCGGSFDVAFEGTDVRVTGTVDCGVPEISGNISTGATYTATMAECMVYNPM